MYEYRATVVRVVDGDTIDCCLDLGFGLQFGSESAPQRFRLAGINAPETRLGPSTTEEDKKLGLKAKEWLRDAVEGKDVVISTRKSTGKYGRWVAEIYHDGVCVNREMVEQGLAEGVDW